MYTICLCALFIFIVDTAKNTRKAPTLVYVSVNVSLENSDYYRIILYGSMI